MSQELIEKLEFYTKDPGQYAAEWTHQTERQAVGVFPNYFPVELLDAAGLLPVGLWGATVPITKADTHVPPFICSLVKSNLELALDGKLKSLSGVVFPEICDSVQNAESIWRSILPDAFTTRYRISKNPASPAAREFLMADLHRIADEIKAHFKVDFIELDLLEAILRRNRLRMKVREMMDNFYRGKMMLHPMDFFILIKASHILDPDEWIKAADDLVLPQGGLAFGGTRVFLSGMTCEPWWILEALDRVDMTIVGDDIAFARRYYAGDVAETGDPYEALADYMLSLQPCANLHHGIFDRADFLVRRVKECKADGVIFTRLKFCDPEAFDHPYLKKRLDAAGIPSLLIETELSATDINTVATRIEAFAEQLEGDRE